ncbi:DUF4269 domain-containing protein [Hymenobacter properus]|uniref:DUF4269 domain-containing protein n=1 Tax=Hymenobacter properus TaxID=2791026 RepID=A0A931FM51_9BACT|nr:DUF4269 domain-containing protein [Hymenobacter properus]MBF9143580.1 DUF4269 domain-containing protein [Hymenobacter properus]MBR7722393.1 DUF4269 domain-containing protein [Microvirga sp. SRT04]
MYDFTNLRYLQHGNHRQQRAYSILAALDLWKVLADFKPVLAGTIPLNIDIIGSDLDVLCEVQVTETQRFIELLQKHYGRRNGFCLTQPIVNGQSSIICNFRYWNREIELFGQPVPTARQNGFRHLLVEAAVLAAGGERWRRAVRRLKKQGMKTEPAFAKLLRLPGDAYAALLELEQLTSAEIAAYVSRCPLPAR